VTLAGVAVGLNAMASSLAAFPAQHGVQEVSLTLRNDLPFSRDAEPVTCGVPLARGLVGKAGQLSLIGPNGTPVPCQVLVTGEYKDRSPRWVLLDFQADLPPKATLTYRLLNREPGGIPNNLSYRREGDFAEINTGAASFRINIRKFSLFDSVKVGGVELIGNAVGGALLQEDGSSQRHGACVLARAEFEDAGTMRVVLAIHGQIRDGQDFTLANYVCRMHFFSGKSEVRMFYTLHNPAAHWHPGNTWDLGAGGSIFIEDFSLILPLAQKERWVTRIGPESDKTPIHAATKLYQDSSGGLNWNSANHIDKDYKVATSFRGYRVYRGNEQIDEGYRASGWLHARSPAGGVAVSVREFYQNFPKSLEFTSGNIRIGLWPGEFAGMHELLGGEQKTHEILFVFHDSKTSDEDVARRMTVFDKPLYAMPDSEAVYATRAFWPTGPLDRQNYGMLEQTCDTFVYPVGSRKASVIGMWEEIDEYGWRHFGDTFADNENSPMQMMKDHPEHFVGGRPISHYGNEYDVNYGVILQGLRRGDPNWMLLADVMCRHYADICVYHTDADGSGAYAHGPFTHTTHGTAAFRSTHRMYPGETRKYYLLYHSGGPNAGHCYVPSLAQHYYLTGNRASRDAFLEVADWSVNSPWFTRPDTHMGDTRGIGNLLMTHVYAYQMTGNRKYYDAAMKMVELARQPFEGLGANLFVKAAGRFLDMKIERDELDGDYEKAREIMLAFGDLYLTLPDDRPGRWLEQTCFHAEVLFTCYLHAPKDHPNRLGYYARGKSLMDRAQSRWPGTYTSTKSLIMCFGNTGAFFKALRVHEQEGHVAGSKIGDAAPARAVGYQSTSVEAR
jgi:hypothetical protein